MCHKAANRHPTTIKYVTECYKDQEICHKVVDRCFLVLDSILDQYKTQEICDLVVFWMVFLIRHSADKVMTQKMSDEAVFDPLASFELIFAWFVTSKINALTFCFFFNKIQNL